ncbi:MAG: hypothetical protein JXR76_02825 [Deltaproteobacteria bacterium]|nr:hypothetical protein [Deltaproteobacteria bacterium]
MRRLIYNRLIASACLPKKKWVPFNAVFAIVLVTGMALSLNVRADDGEFWDAAMASMVYTKRLDRSYFQLKSGMEVLARVSDQKKPPGKYRYLAEVTFYGFKHRRYSRLFALYAGVGLGYHGAESPWYSPGTMLVPAVKDENGTVLEDAYRMDDPSDHDPQLNAGWGLDAFHGRLAVYSYLNGGAFSIGVISADRERAMNEKFTADVQAFEYAAGGALKHFAFTLTTSALGYRHREYYTNRVRKPTQYKSINNYNGFVLLDLNLKMGFIFGIHSPLSFEASYEADIGFAMPRQKDLGTAVEMAWHLNSRKLPLDLSLKAGVKYRQDDWDENPNGARHDFDKRPEFHDQFYYASALVGLRY